MESDWMEEPKKTIVGGNKRCCGSASVSTSARTHVVVNSWALSDDHDHEDGKPQGDEADNMYADHSTDCQLHRRPCAVNLDYAH